jgi:hypothetical protein
MIINSLLQTASAHPKDSRQASTLHTCFAIYTADGLQHAALN